MRCAGRASGRRAAGARRCRRGDSDARRAGSWNGASSSKPRCRRDDRRGRSPGARGSCADRGVMPQQRHEVARRAGRPPSCGTRRRRPRSTEPRMRRSWAPICSLDGVVAAPCARRDDRQQPVGLVADPQRRQRPAPAHVVAEVLAHRVDRRRRRRAGASSGRGSSPIVVGHSALAMWRAARSSARGGARQSAQRATSAAEPEGALGRRPALSPVELRCGASTGRAACASSARSLPAPAGRLRRCCSSACRPAMNASPSDASVRRELLVERSRAGGRIERPVDADDDQLVEPVGECRRRRRRRRR